MANEQENIPEVNESEIAPKVKSSSFNSKILIFGLPIFIVQLVAVYFITANILLSKVESHVTKDSTVSQTHSENADTASKHAGEMGKYIYALEDIIVNPANTDGKRLLLTSIGLDLPSEEEENLLKSKEILIKDQIISTLSSKSLEQLSDVSYKDSLKSEISHKLEQIIPKLKLNNVYFSKYIIQ